MLRISITDESGNVYEILSQQADDGWVDSSGERVADDLRQLIRFELPDVLAGARKWVAV